MKVPVLNIKGKTTGREVELSKKVFGIDPNDHAVYLDVKQFLANQRQGNAKTKERSEIKGSTRKIKKQKGTGTARAGSIKNPLFRGGGTIFGPRTRDYGIKLNKNVKRLARKSALSLKLKAKSISVVETIDFKKPKTKSFAEFISAIGLNTKKTLIVVDGLNKTLNEFGKVDILVNGAGINSPTPFLEINIDEFENVLRSHVNSTLFGCQVFGKHMLDRGSGSIINISSASAGPPLSKAFAYSVAKAGIKNLTQNLGREWGKQGVRVNALRPGFFPTAWNRANFITAERETAILGHTPMARYGEVDELVGGAIYLASDAASFVTGSELTIDGGFSCMSI